MFDFVLSQGTYENELDSQDQPLLPSNSGRIDKILTQNWIMSDDLLPHQILKEGSQT